MENKKKPNGYWNYERCKKEALKYKNKSSFQRGCSSAYNNINKYKWLELLNHMNVIGNKYNRLVYVFLFSDKSFYVGLTGNINRRKNQHLRKDVNSSVYKHITKTGLIPKLILKTNYINVNDAIKKEKEIFDIYINNGWSTLNKVKTGGIGSNQVKWTYEKCKSEAKKYKSITNFQKNSKSSYHAALKNNWIDDICSHIKRNKSINGYWNNYKLCKIESEKHKNRTQFRKNNWSAWNYSFKNGWIDDFFPKYKC